MRVDDPVETASAWIEEARAAGIVGYDAAVVATATPDGRPSARAVLLRGWTSGASSSTRIAGAAKGGSWPPTLGPRW